MKRPYLVKRKDKEDTVFVMADTPKKAAMVAAHRLKRVGDHNLIVNVKSLQDGRALDAYGVKSKDYNVCNLCSLIVDKAWPFL